MNIWLIHLGELLPLDGEVRLFRYGILAETLAERGHHVTRWAPTFVHATKTQRALQDKTIDLNEYYRIELLYAPGYHRHIGLSRFRFHRRVASSFIRRSAHVEVPDLSLVGMPTPEMCLAAVNYGLRHRVPVVIDVRDLWPDVFLEMVPARFRWLARIAMWPMQRMNRHSFQEATAVTAISESYLKWGISYSGRPPSDLDRVFYMGYKKAVVSNLQRLEVEKKWVARGVRRDAFLCVFFGTIGHQFDLDTILAAAKILEKDNADIQFVVCGEGAKLSYYRTIAQHLNNIIFPGWVDATDIAVLMEWAQIGLAPYAAGAKMSLPNKPFEYFSGGLPVVSSLRGELEALLVEGDCGLTYQAGDVNGFLDALQKLRYDSTLRIRMGDNAKRLYKERFSAEHVYPSMIAHLEKIATGQLSTRPKTRHRGR